MLVLDVVQSGQEKDNDVKKNTEEVRDRERKADNGGCFLQVKCDWTRYEMCYPHGGKVWGMEIRASSYVLLLFPR